MSCSWNTSRNATVGICANVHSSVWPFVGARWWGLDRGQRWAMLWVTSVLVSLVCSSVAHWRAAAAMRKAGQGFSPISVALVSADGAMADFPPGMGAEDFSYMLEARPGAYLMLGQGEGAMVHHPKYNFNDDIAPVGASFFARLVERAQPGAAGR